MDWLSLSLLCAFSLASADAATKAWLRGYSVRELVLIRFGLTGLLMIPLLHGLPPVSSLSPQFWGWIAASIPLEVVAMLLYMRAIRDYPLSLTLPYLAFTPVFVVLSGYLLLGETIDSSGFLGILCVVLGGWQLNIAHAELSNWRTWVLPLAAILYERGSRMMLGVALLYSLTATMGKGAMQYMAPQHFGAFYFVLLGAITTLLFSAQKPGITIQIWRRPLAVIGVGLCMGIMVYTHFLALQQVEVAYMIAVKRTSLLFGILYGSLVFQEQGLSTHLLAGSLMLAGVFILAF